MEGMTAVDDAGVKDDDAKVESLFPAEDVDKTMLLNVSAVSLGRSVGLGETVELRIRGYCKFVGRELLEDEGGTEKIVQKIKVTLVEEVREE